MNAAASQSARAPVVASLALSVFLHAGAVGGVASAFVIRDIAGRLAPYLGFAPEPEKEREDPAEAAKKLEEQKKVAAAMADPVIWVRPGIDDSTSDADTWIGFKEESEHAAFAATVDQSAMTMDTPGMNGEEVVATPPAPAGEPLPAAVAPPTPSEPVEIAAPTPAPVVPPPPVAEPVPVAPEARPEAATPPPPLPAPEEPRPEPMAEPVPLPPRMQEPLPEDLERAETAAVPPPPVTTLDREAEPAPDDAKEQETPEKPTEHELEPADLKISTVLDIPVPVVPPPAAQPTPTKDTSQEISEEPKPAPPPSEPSSAPASPATPRTPPATSQPGAQPTPTPAGLPGEQADKEADATSIKQAVDYRNGRVKAGGGLDIKTVRPEFTNFTLLTSIPNDPVVEITFTTRGKVKNVRLLQSSGYKDVDEPILNAVWAWSAKGKRLEELAKQNPNALLKISVRMYL